MHKPFDISTFKYRKESTNKQANSIKTNTNDIFTPFGVLRSFSSRKDDYDLTFKKSWNLFFKKFLNNIRLEMSNGMSKILENISSLVDDGINYELHVIGALSGSNNCDHVITFNVLQEFLNCSGQPYTILLDHEKIGVEGLSISKLLETIWYIIKSTFLDLLIEEIKIIDSCKEYDYENGSLILNSMNLKDSKADCEEKLVNRVKRNKRKCKTENSVVKEIQLDLQNRIINFQFTQTDNIYKLPSIQSIQMNSKASRFSLSNNNHSQKYLNINKGLKVVGSIFRIKKKNNLNIKPIIILIPSSECFSPGQLGQLLEMLSQIKETYKIPFKIVLGISTSTLYVQRIIGQTVFNRLKFVSVKLLDSKKVFFQSIINSLLYLDDFDSNILLKGNSVKSQESNSENLVELNYFYSSSITNSETELFSFPLISTACIKHIKDNFFQYDYSLTSSLKTVFIVFQFYFTNNKYDFFFHQFKEIKMEGFDEDIIDKLKLKYQINKSKLLPEIDNDLKEATITELSQLQLNLKLVALGISILNIIFYDALNIFDINERYNLIIEWLEIIEKNRIEELIKKINSLTCDIKSIENSTLNKNSVFSKINKITELFLTKNKSLFEKKNQILGNKVLWDIKTFEFNISKLFIPSFDRSKFSGYITDNVFHSLIYVNFNVSFEHLDYFLDEMLTPNFITNIIDDFNQTDDNENISDDFSIIYKIYSANKGNKINLFKFFATFCNKINGDLNKCYNISVSKNQLEKINNEQTRINCLPDQYKNLFIRFVRVINTFQIIGLLYLPLKNTKVEQDIFRTNSDNNKDPEKKYQCLNKHLDQYFKFALSNIYAHKLYWGNDMAISDIRTIDKRNKPETHLFDNEEFKLLDFAIDTNKINSNIKYKRKSICSNFIDEPSKNINIKKSKLEVLKLRAAESNQKKIIEFKGIKMQKAINSANKIKNLRNSANEKQMTN
ncbi:uncharacterized protein cubi_02318 [Cryptosporidium ubiquitum]|uniref:Origin recognition complex subunit 3 winged helix C-terminal domain-containing protein n=1 Tax=Cryptosporidium ubiquitum TaxID=857276 RepID=A0A1J4MGE6_9CRYT|nr:uncharacterized protein cubi_02318 [Cryptosporidium ubiquitum]OII73087.1 hypothetical protein cubi_02318 [Cryptosporidium ubiquitum]